MIVLNDLTQFLPNLLTRNASLFYFGLINFFLALILILVSLVYDMDFLGTHALYKPIKFALSIGIYSWTMGWYCFYLEESFPISFFNFSVIGLLGFEMFYIAVQAIRMQPSHYNLSSSIYLFLYVLMAAAAALVTILTAYVAYRFFSQQNLSLSESYVWGIRLALIIFVIFSFEGFLMGSRLKHTVGSADGTEGIFFLNWSKKFGDLRISHFLGMHALQVLPLAGYYLLSSVRQMLVLAAVYFLLTVLTLMIALRGWALF